MSLSNTNNNGYQLITNLDRGDLGIPLHTDLFVKRPNMDIQDLPVCTSIFLNALCCLTAPLSLVCGLRKIHATRDEVIEHCGIPNIILREPGITWINPCCMSSHSVNMRLIDREVKVQNGNDEDGKPIDISGQFTYRVTDHVKYLYKTQDIERFIHDQAATVLRTVAALYPFDVDCERQECLRRPSENIEKSLKDVLQTTLNLVDPGIKVEFFKIMSVNIEKSMEKLLLARQEASAEVIARKTIAEGATGIIQETLQRLTGLGIKLSEQEINRFATTLTLMIVNHGHTTINLFEETINPHSALKMPETQNTK